MNYRSILSSQNKVALIRQRVPVDFKRFVDPAVGDGSIFLHMAPEKWLVNEETSSVHNMWDMVKRNPTEVIRCLQSDFFDEVSKPAHAALYMHIHDYSSIRTHEGFYNNAYFQRIASISEYMNKTEGEIHNKSFADFANGHVDSGDFVFLDYAALKNNDARSVVPDILFDLDKRGVRWMLIHDNNVYVRTMFNRFRSTEMTFNADNLLIQNY